MNGKMCIKYYNNKNIYIFKLIRSCWCFSYAVFFIIGNMFELVFLCLCVCV